MWLGKTDRLDMTLLVLTGPLKFKPTNLSTGLGGSDVLLTGDQSGSDPCSVGQHLFVEIDHEIFSMVILSFLSIHKGQLSVSSKTMCTNSD